LRRSSIRNYTNWPTEPTHKQHLCWQRHWVKRCRSGTLALILGAAFEHRPVLHGPGLLILSAAVLWVAIILFTVTMLVPINNRIAPMNPEHTYSGWRTDRAQRDRLHRVRVVLLIASVLLLLTGLFTSHPTS